jgi:hypothetical protein
MDVEVTVVEISGNALSMGVASSSGISSSIGSAVTVVKGVGAGVELSTVSPGVVSTESGTVHPASARNASKIAR